VVFPLLELPDICIAAVLTYLPLSELSSVSTMNRELYGLNIWRTLCAAHDLPFPNDMSPGECRAHFFKHYLSSYCLRSKDMNVVWGSDARYWKLVSLRSAETSSSGGVGRGVGSQVGSGINNNVFPALSRPFFPLVYHLLHVWWLHITGRFMLPRAGDHHSFLLLGGQSNSFIGSLERYVRVIDSMEYTSPLALPQVDTRSMFRSVARGATTFFWVYLGSARLTSSRGGLVEVHASDITGTIKSSVCFTHCEILPTALLSSEQRDAMENPLGWATASGPGGAFKRFV